MSALSSTWTVPFLVAAMSALLLTPVLRRVALAIDFVDHPTSRKSHSTVVPYLGGVAIVIGTALGALVGPFSGPRTALLIAGGALLAVVGLIDDKRHLGPTVRLVAEVGMALAAYAAGIRAVATGVPALDLLITVLWIAGMANSLNFFDNMDGLATGTAAVAGSSIFLLAALGGQYRIATISIALAAACAAFLAFNFRPASIYMGDAGSLFIGFILSTLTLQVAPDVGPPGSFAVPLLILGIPLLDTVTVVLGRIRHGRSPLVGGKDHLSHRLVAKGFTREASVAVLILAQSTLGVLAVLVGRRVIPAPAALLGALVVVVALIPAATKRGMYSDRRQPLPKVLWAAALGAGGFFLLASIPASLAMLQARQNLRLGAEATESALASGRTGDTVASTEAFGLAESHFASAVNDLDGPLRSMGLAVPGLASNLEAGRVLAATGQRLSAAGTEITGSTNPEDLRVEGGRVDLAALDRVRTELTRASTVLQESRTDVRSLHVPYLVPEAERAIRRLDLQLADAVRDADRASAVADVLPAILGAEGDRRYFLAVQNNAEARATGGFIGNFGELVSEAGRIRLDRFGRIGELNAAPGEVRELRAPEEFNARYARFDVANTWQNINLSPDLPTVAKVVADLYPRSGGKTIHGVIGIDPVGLSGLLRLTGPISVPGWPVPITAENVVVVTLEEAYIRFPDQERRVAFLGEVARAVFDTATTVPLGSPRQIVEALAGPVEGGHLQVALLDAAEDRAMRKVELAGHVPKATADALLLTTQNAAGNKIDTYLRRGVDYEVVVTPERGGKRARVEGTVTVSLANSAPATGLPPSIIGPYEPGFSAGENRTFLSLYTPLALQRASVDGVPTGLESARELGRNVYSAFLSVPPSGTSKVIVDVAGSVPIDDRGRYRLDLLRQPLLQADNVRVQVRAGAGWRLTNATGLRQQSSTIATAEIRTEDRTALRVGLVDAKTRSVLDRLIRPA